MSEKPRPTFETYRRLIFSVAYRMLGSVMEAEDVVQETFIRWNEKQGTTITNPKAYLCQIATRLCLDQLKSAREQRETYVGEWLPEPLVNYEPTQEDTLMLADSLSFAFLVMLEQLSPDERAVFLLREVYDYDYKTIATTIDKSEANCRKLLSRAKKNVKQPAPAPSAEITNRVVMQLNMSMAQGDIDGILSVLHTDVAAWSDGGGKVTAARKPVRGASLVAKFLRGLTRLAPDDLQVEFSLINGQPGVVTRLDGKAFSTMVVHIEGDKIRGIYSVLNPDKLQHL